ncbi:hypothetical protein B0H63DRAFT_544345 [Podospora didyma]|uniref:FAD-binding PCMH-type domain-containing protein n=1 Tax=Podospora didyma TaxID=330526 RepID=A0AAE0NQL1_9PEZI|nr:hypothetical protein B0H63DRAFT_544345 [Podospora didyma]
MLALILAFLSASIRVNGANITDKLFPLGTTQLTNADVEIFSSLAFGVPENAVEMSSCRAWPGSEDWPSEDEWTRFNASVDGALLRPTPVASACYPGPSYNAATCRWLAQQAGRTHFWIDDPLSVLTQWPQGDTCAVSINPKGNCTRGGSPEYVVNATIVKHIQAAVNFARNKNVRVVIKNTGHDFGGRSTGAGSLSIWVHNLKSFEFLPNHTSDAYRGMAVRIGAGMESWELHNHAAQYNITVVAPGGSTVGAVGGWLAGGGHGGLTSKYGLGSDQALAIDVVTADGRFLTADPRTNQDLFWALRGGGPSTYGVITSVIMKAYPPSRLTSVSVQFSVGQGSTIPASSPFPLYNFTPPLNFTFPNITGSVETFWRGINIAYRFSPRVLAVGGYVYSYIYPLGNSSFTLTSSASIPDLDAATITSLMKPLYDDLNAAGINVTLPMIRTPPSSLSSGGGSRTGGGGGDSPINTRYRSRLFPRTNWENDDLFSKTMTAIRRGIEEGGYTFHGIAYSPTYKIAGSPGADSAVNLAWREAVLHGSYMEVQPSGLSAAQARERDAKARRYTDLWREVTPGAGAYMNEGDPAEPDWQASFYGLENYERLARIKARLDPWGLFWARTTVGSEAWEVITDDGYPGSQNGRLCRVR